MGVNGRMQCHPFLKKPHEEATAWGGCLEKEWSWGKALLKGGVLEQEKVMVGGSVQNGFCFRLLP